MFFIGCGRERAHTCFLGVCLVGFVSTQGFRAWEALGVIRPHACMLGHAIDCCFYLLRLQSTTERATILRILGVEPSAVFADNPNALLLRLFSTNTAVRWVLQFTARIRDDAIVLLMRQFVCSFKRRGQFNADCEKKEKKKKKKEKKKKKKKKKEKKKKKKKKKKKSKRSDKTKKRNPVERTKHEIKKDETARILS